MIEKVCFKCRRSLPLSEYYARKEMADGHMNTCKMCTKKRVRRRYKQLVSTPEGLAAERASERNYRERYITDPAWREKRRKYNREYYVADPSHQKRASKKHARAYPERVTARNIAKAAVRAGRLIRAERCARCDSGGSLEGHHADYSKPLDVEWLCTKCHEAKEWMSH